MKRKFGGFLLALCMALCLLPSAAFAADGVACPRCGRTVSAIEGDFAVKLSDMNTKPLSDLSLQRVRKHISCESGAAAPRRHGDLHRRGQM